MTSSTPYDAPWLPPRAVVWLLVAYLAGMVAFLAAPPVLYLLPLRAPLLDDAANPLRLLTYSFVHVGAVHWVMVAAFTWLAAVVLRDRLTGRDMILALAVGAIAGGLAFGLLARDEVLVGGYVAAWGLAGAAAGAFARDRSRFAGWRLAFVVGLPALVALMALTGRIPPLSFLAAAAAGAGVGYRRLASGGKARTEAV